MAAVAQTLSGKININLNIVETVPLGTPSQQYSQTLNPIPQWGAGNSAVASGINQWFMPASTPITLASGASVTYLLSALTDGITRTISMVGGVRGWGVFVTTRTAGDFLTVGQAATSPWTSPFVGTTPGIKVYDFFALGALQTDGYAVVGGSNEQIKIANSGANPITFNFIAFGCLT